MDIPVAVHQGIVDVIVRHAKMSVYPLRPVRMELNVHQENIKIILVHADPDGLENNATNEKVSLNE